MTFTTDSLARSAFKVLRGKAHTSDSKDLVNEAQVSTPSIAAQTIFSNTLSSTPSVAVSSNYAAFVTIPLVLDSSSNGKAYLATITGSVPSGLVGKINAYVGAPYATGQRVGNFIPESIGQNYRAVLKDGSTEITPLASQDWFFDYASGIVTSEDNLGLSSGTIDGYIYLGELVSATLDRHDGYAVWQRLSDDGYFAPTGNAGIGTSTPSTKLHVRKDQNSATTLTVQNNTTGTGAYSQIEMITDAGSAIDVQAVSSGYSTSGMTIANSGRIHTTSGLSGGLVLSTDSTAPMIFGTNNAERLRIDSSGNVSIGTSSASTLLHLQSATTAGSTIRLDFNDTTWTIGDVIGRIEFFGNDASASASGVRARLEAAAESTSGATKLSFYTTTSSSTTLNEVLQITGTKQVGVNVSTPSTLMDIRQTSTGATLTIGTDATSSSANTVLGRVSYLGYDGTGTQVARAQVDAVYSDSAGSTELWFLTSATLGGATAKLRIDSTGQVSIGSRAPSNKLNISSDGSVTVPVISMGAADDSNTGIYHPAADTLAITTGGSEIARFTTTQILSSISGSAGTPAFSFVGDTDNGFYHPGTNQVGLSIFGTERTLWSNSEIVMNTILRLTPSVGLQLGTSSSGTTVEYTEASDRLAFNVATFNKMELNPMGMALGMRSATISSASGNITPTASIMVITHTTGGTFGVNAGTADGQILILYFFAITGTVTYADNLGNLRLAGDFVATDGDTLTLFYDGVGTNDWVEIARSHN